MTWQCYLGSSFTSDRSTTTGIRVHGSNNMCHTLKFISCVNKNNDIPFVIKRRVFEAALTSTLLYGCESWLTGAIRPVTKQYMWWIKQMLGVRKTTPNVLCLIELGCPPLQALVNQKQRKFFSGISSNNLSEVERVSWTRLRISGHSLAVGEGRWNRRGRGGGLPLEERLRSCNQI